MAKSSFVTSIPRRIGDGFIRAIMAKDTTLTKETASDKLREAMTFKALVLGSDSALTKDWNSMVESFYKKAIAGFEKESNPVRKAYLIGTCQRQIKLLVENTALPTATQATVYRELLVANGKIPASLDAETVSDETETVEEAAY